MVVGFLLNTSEPYYHGGYEKRALSFGRELVRQGHEVRIYTSCPRDEIIEGVRFIRVGPMRPFFNARGVRNGWADLLFSFAILRLLRNPDFGELDVLDVCATPFIHLPFVALVAWIRRVPVVMTCHEALLVSIPAYTKERGCQNRAARWLFAQVFSFLYRLGMGLLPLRVANSHGTADALAREGYPARGVVATGVERETFNPKPPEGLPEAEPARFVFCGRLTPIKNVDSALLALLPLREESPSFHFDILGDGAERSRLEQMTRDAGAKKWVTFHGHVTEEAKRALLGASEIFLLSSPREGLSLATLEAMAQGCGALIVNDPACPNGALDFIRHHEQGLVVPPGVDPMREALQALIKGRDFRLGLRRAAWLKAREYGVEGQTHRLVAFYRESLNVPA